MKKAFALTAAAAAIFANLIFAPAAFAHDEVTATSPTSGETVEAGQIPISVTFNEDVLADAELAGFAIEVTDSKGAQQPSGCLMAGGTVVSAITSLATAGDYTVNWRSVSNDGHPNEGTYKFTLANTSGYEQETVDALGCPMLMDATPLAMPLAIDDSMKRDASAGDEGSEGNGALGGLAIGAGFIVLGAIATAVTVKLREKRAGKKSGAKSTDDYVSHTED